MGRDGRFVDETRTLVYAKKEGSRGSQRLVTDGSVVDIGRGSHARVGPLLSVVYANETLIDVERELASREYAVSRNGDKAVCRVTGGSLAGGTDPIDLCRVGEVEASATWREVGVDARRGL